MKVYTENIISEIMMTSFVNGGMFSVMMDPKMITKFTRMDDFMVFAYTFIPQSQPMFSSFVMYASSK